MLDFREIQKWDIIEDNHILISHTYLVKARKIVCVSCWEMVQYTLIFRLYKRFVFEFLNIEASKIWTLVKRRVHVLSNKCLTSKVLIVASFSFFFVRIILFHILHDVDCSITLCHVIFQNIKCSGSQPSYYTLVLDTADLETPFIALAHKSGREDGNNVFKGIFRARLGALGRWGNAKTPQDVKI